MRNALRTFIMAFALIALSASAFAYSSYSNMPRVYPAVSTYYVSYGGYGSYDPYYNTSYTYPYQTMHSSVYPGAYYTNTPRGIVSVPDNYYYPHSTTYTAYGPAAVYYNSYPSYGNYSPYSNYPSYNSRSCGYGDSCGYNKHFGDDYYGNDYYGSISVSYAGDCAGFSCEISFSCSDNDC